MKYIIFILILIRVSYSQSPRDTLIKNLEYVTVKYITGEKKLYHMDYLVKRNGSYYYPNMYPVMVINYKQKDSLEVVVKK
jgi:hypothetical protein